MKKTINGKEYDVKEMSYIQALEFDGDTKPEIARKMLKFCVGLSDEEIEKLSIKEGIEIQKAINEVNNLSGFQLPTEKNE